MTRKPVILIVEDDEVTSECISDLLSDEGYATKVLPAPRTVEGVRQARPDLVLLDLIFPELEGEELLRAMRQERDLAALPVILLSAAPRLAERAAGLPVQGHMCKPFELDALLHAVGELAGRPLPCRAQSKLHCAPATSAPTRF